MPSALTYPTKGEILLPQLFNELAREMCGSPVRGKPLFSEVYLDHPTRAAAHCDKLLHLVQHSRDFAQSIKTVYITEHPTTDDGASCSWLTTENSLPQLLSSLESLSALSISCSSGYLEWRTLPIKLSTSFSSLFKKVTSLQLSSVEGVPIAPMSFSRLEHLGLNDVTPGKMHPLDLTFFDQSHEIEKRSLSSLSVINSLSAMKELFDCLSHSNSRLDLSLLHFLEIGFSKDEEMEGACLTLSAVSQSIRHLDVQHVLPTAFDSRGETSILIIYTVIALIRNNRVSFEISQPPPIPQSLVAIALCRLFLPRVPIRERPQSPPFFTQSAAANLKPE
jgi:hypothetical protein